MKYFPVKLVFVFVLMNLLAACSDDKPSQQNSAVEVRSGKQLFEDNCAACHGMDGTAGVAKAANLRLSKLDSATIYHAVNEGRGGMPSFRNKFSDDEMIRLENYVQGLRK